MKEATGELNMTVVTIVAIAALLAFFYLVIWPNLQTGMALSSACSAANGQTYNTTGNGFTITCSSGTCNYTRTGTNTIAASRECKDTTG